MTAVQAKTEDELRACHDMAERSFDVAYQGCYGYFWPTMEEYRAAFRVYAVLNEKGETVGACRVFPDGLVNGFNAVPEVWADAANTVAAKIYADLGACRCQGTTDAVREYLASTHKNWFDEGRDTQIIRWEP